MTLKYPSSSFFESVGGSGFQFTEKLRDAVADHICTIWTLYPSFITNAQNPASSYARGFMNSACSLGGYSPPPLASPFTGGQCEVKYDVNLEVSVFPSTTSCSRPPDAVSNFSVSVWGEITDIYLSNPTGECGGSRTVVIDCHGSAFNARTVDVVPFVVSDSSYGRYLEITNINIVRQDGLPDDCGNPTPTYPSSPQPTAGDLNTTIVINNEDGIDLTIPLTWNKISPNFNFPISVDVGGVNITVDLGGMTFQGDRNVGDPSGTNILPEGDKEITEPDGTVVIIPRGQEEVVLPEFPVNPPIDAVLEWVVCESGILEVVSETVALIPNLAPLAKIIIDLLVSVIQEVCVEEGELGFPEIYPVLPGVDRPIIMYYYKEVIGGIKQASTWVSTLPNPNVGAISEIETANYPDRSLGNFVYSLKLKDGSRIVARGVDEANALSHFQFLLNRVDASLVPENVASNRVLTEYDKMQEINVKCSQVEYYPDGKSFGRNPSVRRIIRFDSA